MANPNGGPAFPQQPVADLGGEGRVPVYFRGLSMRDYFAAQAMGAIFMLHADSVPQWDADEVAESSYILADAMLKERAKV